jgi:hypothetical protein
MNQPCEACERAEGNIVEPCDDARDPYRLCAACHQRLHARSLRPLEWFNLAKRHSWDQFLLHDDFYDEDGTAVQPEAGVDNGQAFSAPTLASVRQDSERLLDYSITRWRLQPDVITAWNDKDSRSVLSTLSARFASTSNIQIRARVLSICASAVRESGANFVRRAWEEYPENVALIPLAEASAACLPHAEGFERVTSALARLEGREKRDQAFCLSYFRSADALAWIERNVFEPITESWGYLAAASNIDWPRVEAWLDRGRPLSLVAIDALLAIARPRTPFLRESKPTLATPPGTSRLREVLLAYCERDPVPRVQQRVDALLANPGELTMGLING